MSGSVSPANAYVCTPQMDVGRNIHRKLSRASGARRGSMRCPACDPGKAKKKVVSIRGSDIHRRTDVKLRAGVKDRAKVHVVARVKATDKVGVCVAQGWDIVHELQAKTGSEQG